MLLIKDIREIAIDVPRKKIIKGDARERILVSPDSGADHIIINASADGLSDHCIVIKIDK